MTHFSSFFDFLFKELTCFKTAITNPFCQFRNDFFFMRNKSSTRTAAFTFPTSQHCPERLFHIFRSYYLLNNIAFSAHNFCLQFSGPNFFENPKQETYQTLPDDICFSFPVLRLLLLWLIPLGSMMSNSYSLSYAD